MEKSEKKEKLYSYEVVHKGSEDILTFNYKNAQFSPSISESEQVMQRTIDALIENPNVSRIIFEQEKRYNYDFTETNYLLEISGFYVFF